MAARSCLKCKEQRLIGFEGYNCGSTAVVKCRWAALLHRLPQSKNHVVAERILPFTNLLYLTLKLSKSRLWEVPSSCLCLISGTREGANHGPAVVTLVLFTNVPESSALGTDQQILFFPLAVIKRPLPTPTHLLRILPSFPQTATFAAQYFNMMLITFYRLYLLSLFLLNPCFQISLCVL